MAVKGGDFLSREEEVELSARAREGDREARERLILSVLPLAKRLAMKGRARDLDDRISAAFVAVVESVGQYDASLGSRFTSYAHYAVSMRLLDCRDNRDLIHVPVATISNHRRHPKDRDGSDDRVLAMAKAVSRGIASMDLDFAARIVDDAPSHADRAETDDLMEAVYSHLLPDERELLCSLYGIGRPQESTWEYAARSGMTRGQVKHRRQALLDRLRVLMKARAS